MKPALNLIFYWGFVSGMIPFFSNMAAAMTTVFEVKDRVLGHNPLAVLSTLDSYYEWLLKSEINPDL
jgi:uncharacterized metal-binding protein